MTLEEAIAALKAAQSKIDSLETELKKHADAKNESQRAALQGQIDAANAALDAAKADVKRLTDAKETKGREDAAIVEKVAIIDGARTLHGKADAVDVKQPNREIMVAALVARDSGFKADGKSDAYIAAAFDIAVKAQEKANKSNDGAMRATAVGGTTNIDGTANFEFVTDEKARIVREYDAAVFGHQAWMKARYKGEAEADKARADATKLVEVGKMDGRGRGLGRDFIRPTFDGEEIMNRGVAWVRENVSRNDLHMFARVNDLRTDSDPATAFFQRQLMYVITQPYYRVYADIKYMTLFPVTYEVPTGASTWEAKQFDELGQADIVDDYADDAPDAELVGQELIGKIYPVRSQFQYSLQDIRRAMMGGLPLDAMKAAVARRIIERKCDALAATGDTTRSMVGAANMTNATTSTAITKAAGGTKWITLSTGVISATPDEMLNDINVLYSAIFNGTGGNIEPDTLYVSKSIWGVLQTKRLDSFNQVTVGSYLRDKLSWLKRIEYWPRLNTAGSGGIERIMMAKVDPEYFRFVVPQEFEVLPPQPRNMSWVNPCHKRWGEPQCMQPKTLAYMDSLVA